MQVNLQILIINEKGKWCLTGSQKRIKSNSLHLPIMLRSFKLNENKTMGILLSKSEVKKRNKERSKQTELVCSF